MGRVLGVDVGTVRIGVAISDETGLIARPLETVRRTGDRKALGALARMAREHEVVRIVVGLPLTMGGGEQESSVDAREFAGKLRTRAGCEVLVWDERLTTAQAERALIEGGVRRKQRREVVDRIAAAVMLQSYLDSIPRDAAPGPEGTAW
jgi:putative Holliday junction resolvase